jgi:aryl-alcohol dehydrogenase-like predicted oxidoreductase
LIGKNFIKNFLIHNPKYYLQNKTYFNTELKKLKVKLGISFNEPNELKKTTNSLFSYYQFPFNIIDRRWDNFINKKNRNQKYFIRSILLQGLFFAEKKNIPIKFRKKFLKIKEQLNKFVVKFERFDLKDLLISFVNSYKEIDGIIIGINNLKQLKELPFYFYQSKLKKNQREQIIESINAGNKIISPHKWYN